MLLAGKGKIGKSYLVLSIAIAVGTGGRVLGHLRAEPCDVMYLCLEDGEELLQERTEQMLVNDPDTDASRIMYTDEWAPLSNGGLEDLEAHLDANPATKLVIIDTLKKVRESVSATDRRQLYDIDYDSLAGLTKLAHERRIAVVVIHHTKKGEADDPIDLISGSIGLSASVDGAMVLTRKRMEQDAELMVAYRGMSERSYSLYRDQETNGWVWAGDAEQRRLSAEREAIIDVLRNQRRPMKPREVAEAMDRLHETGNIGRLMNTMLGQGQLEQTRYGQYTLPTSNSDRYSDLSSRRDLSEKRDLTDLSDLTSAQKPPNMASTFSRSDSTQISQITQIGFSQKEAADLIRRIRDGDGAIWLDDAGRVAWSPPVDAPSHMEAAVNQLYAAIVAELRAESAR